MADQPLQRQTLGLGGLFKALLWVGVFYYVLFAGLGLETDRELSRVVEEEDSAATQTQSASQ